MISIKKYGRKWHIYGEESLLAPWAEDIDQIPGQLIKKNKNRKVWRVTANNGVDYFVKRERKFHLPFTVSKAEKSTWHTHCWKKKGFPALNVLHGLPLLTML